MAESRNRRPKDRNTFVSTAVDPLDRQLRRLRSDTDNVKLEVESLPAATVAAAPEIDLSSLDLSGGGGGVIIGTVVEFNPFSQVATVTLSNGFTTDMLSFATFQLAPNDVVSCVPLQDESGYVITGVSRLPNYIPPVWSVPVVSEDYPLETTSLLYPPVGFIDGSWDIDLNNNIGLGANTLFAGGEEVSTTSTWDNGLSRAYLTIVTPGASYTEYIRIEQAGYVNSVRIFGNRVFLSTYSKETFTNADVKVYTWNPSSGLELLIESTRPQNLTSGYDFSEFGGRLYIYPGSVATGGVAELYSIGSAENVPTLESTTGNAISIYGVNNGHLWSSRGYHDGLDLNTVVHSVVSPGQSKVVNDNGDLYSLYNISGYADLYRVTTSGQITEWQDIMDPVDKPFVVSFYPGGRIDIMPGALSVPPTIYTSGILASTDGVSNFYTPAIWSINVSSYPASSIRVWTGDLHTETNSNIRCQARFVSPNVLSWFVVAPRDQDIDDTYNYTFLYAGTL